MVNRVVVEIIGRRIMNKEENPKTHLPFKLSDIIHDGYKAAIENWIIEQSGAIE